MLQVWPAGVSTKVPDLEHLAIVRSHGDAHGQGIHADSRRTGFTILTAIGKPQHLVVVLHGFRAMRIYNEIVADREDATRVLRERLHDHRVFSDAEWQRVESKAWEFLVHKEFEARRLPEFQAVRVPIQQGGSVVLDTRCLHAGAPGDGSPGLRAHAYGLVYDDDAEPESAGDALHNDHLNTVDILNTHYAPVGTWGKRSGLWG